MRHPIEQAVFASVRCVTCGAKFGGCDCAEKQKEKWIAKETDKLLKLSDEELLAECERLGVSVRVSDKGKVRR